MQWVPHKLLLWNTYTTNILQNKYSIMQLTCGWMVKPFWWYYILVIAEELKGVIAI